jgi:Holliday junction resolvase
MREMSEAGWLCASRRHIAGPGDVLAIFLNRMPLLIEVKTTAAGPFERFGPKDRNDLLTAASKSGALALVAWRPAGAPTFSMLPPAAWPKDKSAPPLESNGAG